MLFTFEEHDTPTGRQFSEIKPDGDTIDDLLCDIEQQLLFALEHGSIPPLSKLAGTYWVASRIQVLLLKQMEQSANCPMKDSVSPPTPH